MSDITVRTEFPRKVREIENTWIPMPDGTRLAARIWLPEDAEADPVPAILEYLPYRKRDGTVARDHLTHPYFAGHGYAGVRVDMRGTGDSEGVCLGEYLLQEQDDALAVIEWLAAQPWCSGKVGMIGISWGGFNGLQIAARRPPALGAVVTLCSTDDRYADDIHYMGGAMLVEKLGWGATAFAIANTPPDPAIVGDRWRDIWKERLASNGLWLLDWMRHQRRDELYRHGSICEDYAAVEVPVYAVGGYADGYTNPIFRMMENLSCPRKALVGPWAHKYPHFATPGPRIGFLQECLRWWDQHLKGIETGIMDEPMIRAWIQDPAPPSVSPVERPGRWVAEPGWPSGHSEITSLYLDGDRLSATPQPDAAPIEISCPETAGHSTQVWCMYGAGDDGARDQNEEIGYMRIFETAPLDQDLDLFGFPMLHVKVSSSVAQANLAAVLSLVAPDGRATFVTHGVLNLTHRNSHSEPEALIPGTPVDACVQLNVVGQKLPAGYKLRLALSQSYWPMIWPSSEKAQLTLYPEDTRLDLPVRPHKASDRDLPDFLRPESATPLEVDVVEPGSGHRTRSINFGTGIETHERYDDTGLVTHLHTGITLRAVCSDRFSIHPDDPNTAVGNCVWQKSFARDGWKAELEARVRIEARKDAWFLTATLTAGDADGPVISREWTDIIPRDLV